MAKAKLSLLKYAIFALLIGAMVPMFEGAKVSKKEAVVDKSKMVNEENKGQCAKPGETCNPSTQISCCKGSTCNIPDSKPGASGTCVSENKEQCKKVREICNISARVVCCEGLECVEQKHKGVMVGVPGTCMYKCASKGETCNPSTQHFCCEHLSCKPDKPGLLGGSGKCVASA